jgi:hypothetical protein
MIASRRHTSSPTSLGLLRLLLILHQIYNLVRYPQVFDIVASDVAFWQSEELVAFRARLDHFF